jgi:hypothetical protein
MPFDGTGFPRVLTETEARDLAVLKRARHRIRYRWMWGKGDSAWGHCALSAIRGAGGDAAYHRLHAQIPPGWHRITVYNDHPSTTHADVLGLFDRAIAALEGGE